MWACSATWKTSEEYFHYYLYFCKIYEDYRTLGRIVNIAAGIFWLHSSNASLPHLTVHPYSQSFDFIALQTCIVVELSRCRIDHNSCHGGHIYLLDLHCILQYIVVLFSQVNVQGFLDFNPKAMYSDIVVFFTFSGKYWGNNIL
jgi:hypothetical protein